MTNSERITAHNARLAAMKETVAGLPEAGGGAVETCTVTITLNRSSMIRVDYTTTENNEIIGKSETADTPITGGSTSKEIVVLKNSAISIIRTGYIEMMDFEAINSCEVNGGEILQTTNEAYDYTPAYFTVLMHSDGTITLS